MADGPARIELAEMEVRLLLVEEGEGVDATWSPVARITSDLGEMERTLTKQVVEEVTRMGLVVMDDAAMSEKGSRGGDDW